MLSAIELGLEPAQASARRRRIGKMKEPGGQELQQYHVGDPMISTGLISAGIVGLPFSVFSMYFSLSLSSSVFFLVLPLVSFSQLTRPFSKGLTSA